MTGTLEPCVASTAILNASEEVMDGNKGTNKGLCLFTIAMNVRIHLLCSFIDSLYVLWGFKKSVVL